MIPFIISTLLFIISEILPFTPTRYNGLLHSLYICLTETKNIFDYYEEPLQNPV
jgi:hypothetical protein